MGPALVALALQYVQPVVIVHESEFERLARQTHELTERVDRENARIRASKRLRASGVAKSKASMRRGSSPSVSLADEIAKLAALRQRGLLSLSELAAAKAKLLKR